ncbi:MAG: hypothetical protein RR191_06075 [Cetobacterium sp.]|uniref:general secretion pathway protein GspD n=1 Tax=unclassified Cetobacterium TaxID=2630983 RepID=UPI00163C633F|nr:general secretion pathway protein GspD [Cetobacterium sp. 2A]MBC2856320.1 general secretion pathway protein GspD [Cetobacterium sp. 2A]
MIFKVGIIFVMVIFKIFSLELENILYSRELDIKEASITDVFAELSKFSGITILADRECKNEIIDVYFKPQTSVGDILKSIEKAYGLKMVRNERGIIFSRENIKGKSTIVGKVINQKTGSGIGGARIKLSKNEDPIGISGEAGTYIVQGIPAGVHMLFAEKNGFLSNGEFIEIKDGVTKQDIYLTKEYNNSDREKEKEEYNTNFEKNAIIEHIALKNLAPEEAEEILLKSFPRELNLSLSHRSNGIIIRGNYKEVVVAKKLLASLDKEYRQARVEAQILDVTDNLFQNIGIKWFYSENGSKNSGLEVGVLENTIIEGIGEVYSSGIKLVRKYNGGNDVLGLGIDLLQGTQDLYVSALPTLIIMNNKIGEFKMTEEVIVGESQDENEESGRVFSTPLFKEAGIILKVLPKIKDKNSIELTIWLEVSDFKLNKPLKNHESENGGTFNSNGGSKISRSLNTNVTVRNNETIFIGGLKRTIEQNLKSQVPFLGDIPYLGVFFKSKSVKKQITDLYIKLNVEVLE